MAKGNLILGAILSAVCVVATARAADIGDSDLQMVQVYYQPTLMASVDEAIAALNLLHQSYSDWRGGMPTGGFATKAHVDLHTNIHYTDTNTQWVPSWGGIIGPGGSYTPYMGGSNQTSQSERDEGADVSVTPSQISQVTLWRYPNLERDFKYGFDLSITQSDGKTKVTSFRTSTIDIARRLADAFETLAAANFTDTRFTPSFGLRVANKDAAEKAAKLGWTGTGGVLIESVLDDSPGKAAGVIADDIVIEAAGQPVPSADALGQIGLKALNGKPNGAVALKVFRGGQTLELTANLANPNVGIEKLLPAPPSPPVAATTAIHLGVSARPLTPAEAKKAKRADGVMIAGVDKGSLAEQMAIQAGDVLVAINALPIGDMGALKKALTAGGDVHSVTVLRAGKTLTLTGVSKM